MEQNVDFSDLQANADMMNMSAFELGKKSASLSRLDEVNPFPSDDARYKEWIKGFRSWRCSKTVDMFA